MAGTSNVSLSTNAPLSYLEWIRYQSSVVPENTQKMYLAYIQEWYNAQKGKDETTKNVIKQQFIQLAKDLSFLFANAETNDPFLTNIDYDNDDDLIYAIPFFAQKLKQIAIVLQNKRENVKRAKLKYNLIGSNEGVEKLLYEYVLRGFTNTENSITQVPASPLLSLFPDLTSVKDSFYMEVEELHDTQSYYDSDPSLDISSYVDLETFSNYFPFESLNEDEIKAILQTRFLSRVAETPLSNIFKEYVLSLPTTSSTLTADKTNLVYNSIYASEKYLGEPVYGLTAVRLKEINKPDLILDLNFKPGNNWFFWPSGNKVTNDSIFNNVFEPIQLYESNLIESGAIGGTTYKNSDLIFTDKNGIVEGAWLRGPHVDTGEEIMSVNIDARSKKDFIYPYPGIVLNSKGLGFLTYSTDDSSNYIIDSLAQTIKNDVVSSYYTSVLPTSACNPTYLNQTSLIECGAYSSTFSPDGDNIIKKAKLSSIVANYDENTYGAIEQAYLYRFQKTDLPISLGLTQIHWPVFTYETSNNSPITIKNDFCLPSKLSQFDPSNTMVGSIAGLSFETGDVIYRYSTRSGDPLEAAWLGSKSLTYLDKNYDSIQVYSTSAIRCTEPIDGAVQSSLSFKAKAGEKVSFVWMDVDTPADAVFKYIEHLPNCQYGKTYPHNLYVDQDYQNINPINSTDHWKKCTCKSVHYSPIGHDGESIMDYNGMSDFIFADPDGVGVDFALNTWTDTRGYNPKTSPQFAFYKVTTGDIGVGWGRGYWKNGNGTPFILKTGRRYVYYRNSLRTDTTSSNNAPYFICNYAYKNIRGMRDIESSYDLVIVLDISKSEQRYIETMKSIVSSLVEKIQKDNPNIVQIALVTFGTDPKLRSFLTREWSTLQFLTSQIQRPTEPREYQTDIASALTIANAILTTSLTNFEITKNYEYKVRDLCSALNYTIYEKTVRSSNYVNSPVVGTPKKILIFTDGDETINQGFASVAAEESKEKGIEIYGINIGELSNTNVLLEKISNSTNTYFDLQSFLVAGDGDVNSFVEYITMKINGSYSIRPMWYKAIRNEDGNWVGTRELSDMVIYPGDYIGYVHRNEATYTMPTKFNAQFSLPAITFTINVKLEGWDYDRNEFQSYNYGKMYGAKPFWAKVYTSPDADNNWSKGTMAFGGHVRFYNDYTPIHQPEISSMILENGDNIEYIHVGRNNMAWKQPITMNNIISTYRWNQLNISYDYSNLSDFLRSGKIDSIVSDTFIESNMILEGYSTFKPAYYNYYAMSAFNYTEGLFYKNRCADSFVVFNTAVAINPSEPYVHMENVHFPTVATVSLPSKAVTEKQVGEFMLPEKLGVPYYRGKGYEAEIDFDMLTYIDSISSERLFLDIAKYGSRNRGLSKNDQLIPVKTKSISNDWIVEPYKANDKGGVIINTLENQKLTPYQTSYEIYGKNHYGIARQNDIFQFWTPADPAVWNDEKNYPLTERKELPASEYRKRIEKLLINKGEMKNWRSDIFGNQYGLYKKFSPQDINGLYMWFSADYGVINEISNDPIQPDYLADSDQRSNVSKWIDRSGKNYNLFSDIGTPTYYIEPELNNKPAIRFDKYNNLKNSFNIDTEEATMFIVAKYYNANNSYAKNYYQVIAGFGSDTFTNDVSVNRGSLVFGNAYGHFTFDFGNNSGFTTFTNQVILSTIPNQITYTKTFLENEEWIVPPGVTQVSALVVGGGGGGGAGTNLMGGFGGGGGGVSYDVIPAISGNKIFVVVGKGGKSIEDIDYNSQTYYYGESGGLSSFDSISAFGGMGGGYALSSMQMVSGGYGTLFYGGSGGIGYNSISSISSTVGEDGKYFSLDDTYYGGGGSGSYENSLTDTVLGGGGGGSTPNGGAGQFGVDGLGGGGGAGYNDRGGDGGDGVVKIWWKTNILEIYGPVQELVYETSVSDVFSMDPPHYPPAQKFYAFESGFKRPYIQTYINGKIFSSMIVGFVDSTEFVEYSEMSGMWDSKLFSNGGFYVGSYVNGTLRTDCSVAEIIYYNRALTKSERREIHIYLREKYGLAIID